jgi:hypothetical protein
MINTSYTGAVIRIGPIGRYTGASRLVPRPCGLQNEQRQGSGVLEHVLVRICFGGELQIVQRHVECILGQWMLAEREQSCTPASLGNPHVATSSRRSL